MRQIKSGPGAPQEKGPWLKKRTVGRGRWDCSCAGSWAFEKERGEKTTLGAFIRGETAFSLGSKAAYLQINIPWFIRASLPNVKGVK